MGELALFLLLELFFSKKREIVSETKSKFKITRTVKNEISSAAQFAYSDSDEIEVNLKPTKKSKKTKARWKFEKVNKKLAFCRAVFENAAEMKVQSEESLDELSSESGWDLFVQGLFCGTKNELCFREFGIWRQQGTNVCTESWRQTRSSEKSQISFKVKVSLYTACRE